MPVIRQIRAGAAEFQGTAGLGGFWSFQSFNALPRSTGIIIGLVGYFEEALGGVLATDVNCWTQLPGIDQTARVPIGLGQASDALLNPITSNADLRLCGIELPREPGDGGPFWNVHLTTKNKTKNGTATLQYRIVPGPESSARDPRA